MERRLRLRNTNDVRKVYSEGRSWAHALLVLIARPNGLSLTRVGVAASRKLGGAVVRNRAKRMLREAARHLYPHMAPGWDIMLVARPPITRVQEPQVEEALILLLKQSRLGIEQSTGPEG